MLIRMQPSTVILEEITASICSKGEIKATLLVIRMIATKKKTSRVFPNGLLLCEWGKNIEHPQYHVLLSFAPFRCEAHELTFEYPNTQKMVIIILP